MMALWMMLTGCSATLQIYGAPEGANVYVTKAPSPPERPPVAVVGQGKLPTTIRVPYVAWDDFWVWVGKDGYEPQLVAVPDELKVGNLVVGLLCFLPSLFWVVGPTEDPLYFDLQPSAPPPPSEPQPLAIPGPPPARLSDPVEPPE